MKVIHHENGDSEYTLNVKVQKACSDKRGMNVQIGELLTIYIENQHDGAAIFCYNELVKAGFKDVHEAMDWLLIKLEA